MKYQASIFCGNAIGVKVAELENVPVNEQAISFVLKEFVKRMNWHHILAICFVPGLDSETNKCLAKYELVIQ